MEVFIRGFNDRILKNVNGALGITEMRRDIKDNVEAPEKPSKLLSLDKRDR